MALSPPSAWRTRKFAFFRIETTTPSTASVSSTTRIVSGVFANDSTILFCHLSRSIVDTNLEGGSYRNWQEASKAWRWATSSRQVFCRRIKQHCAPASPYCRINILVGESFYATTGNPALFRRLLMTATCFLALMKCTWVAARTPPETQYNRAAATPPVPIDGSPLVAKKSTTGHCLAFCHLNRCPNPRTQHNCMAVTGSRLLPSPAASPVAQENLPLSYFRRFEL